MKNATPKLEPIALVIKSFEEVGESESDVESNRQRDFLTEPDGSFFVRRK